MLNNMFQGIFDTEMTTVIAVPDFLLCVGCALVIGLILAGAYMYGTRYTKSFVATLAVLPAIVCVVIMMVNGNVGAGVAGHSVWFVSGRYRDPQKRSELFSLQWEPVW